MIKRILFLIAGTAFLAACETASTTTGDASGEVTTSAATETSSTATTTATSSTAAETAEAAEEQLSPAEQLKRDLAKVGTIVLFDFDSSELSSHAQRTLDRQAAFLQARPQARIIIGGHADERGTREYNLALGERRASAARDYLVSKGVDSARIRIVSYGKERPIAVGSNENAWRQNRRAETVLN